MERGRGRLDEHRQPSCAGEGEVQGGRGIQPHLHAVPLQGGVRHAARDARGQRDLRRGATRRTSCKSLREPRDRGRARGRRTDRSGDQGRRREEPRRPGAVGQRHRDAGPDQEARRPTTSTGGTFTITNPGPFGSKLSVPIIPQGQTAILAFEAIEKRVVVTDDDAIAIRRWASCRCRGITARSTAPRQPSSWRAPRAHRDHRLLGGAVAVPVRRTPGDGWVEHRQDRCTAAWLGRVDYAGRVVVAARAVPRAPRR